MLHDRLVSRKTPRSVPAIISSRFESPGSRLTLVMRMRGRRGQPSARMVPLLSWPMAAAGAKLMASEAVREAAHLQLVLAGGRGVHATAGFDDGLMERHTFAAGKESMLADEFERALANAYLRHPGHAGVRLHQQLQLGV